MIRTLWATAALLALFAMHGLAAHGTAHAPVPEIPAAAVHLDHATGHGDHGGGLLGLCLAVLVGAAVALLGLRRPRTGLLALLPRADDAPARPHSARRHHDPPDLFALSVQRC